MLWSLIKIFVFLALVAAITYGATQLLETSGGVTIEVAGIELTLGPLQSAIAIVALIFVVWVVLKVVGLLVALLRFINGDETAFSRYFDRNRERRGFEALSDGLMALASGDSREALAKAKKADKYLNRPELTNLVVAQAAEASGDKAMALDTYKKLLANPKTKFVGVHGLLKQKLADGDTDTALKLAERAFALKPKHVDTQDMLLQLQTGSEDWQGARITLGAKLQHGVMPRDLHRRRDGVLALSQARVFREDGQLDKAHEMAIEANRLTPALVPAAVMTARGYLEHDKPKLAAKVLRAAWELEPHPELAAAFAAIVPDEGAEARIKRFRVLTKRPADHAETKMLLAEMNIAAENYPAARAAMGDLSKVDPTMRSLTIMAAIEQGDGAPDQVVRQLLTQAMSAQRDPQWICDACGDVHKDWEPICLNCSAMDSVGWKRPGSNDTVDPNMVPLIVGPSPVDTMEIAEPIAAIEVLEAEDVIDERS
ncbi:MAG: heme biosynthesis protein HemY [Planktomarina sp.]